MAQIQSRTPVPVCFVWFPGDVPVLGASAGIKSASTSTDYTAIPPSYPSKPLFRVGKAFRFSGARFIATKSKLN